MQDKTGGERNKNLLSLFFFFWSSLFWKSLFITQWSGGHLVKNCNGNGWWWWWWLVMGIDGFHKSVGIFCKRTKIFVIDLLLSEHTERILVSGLPVLFQWFQYPFVLIVLDTTNWIGIVVCYCCFFFFFVFHWLGAGTYINSA